MPFQESPLTRLQRHARVRVGRTGRRVLTVVRLVAPEAVAEITERTLASSIVALTIHEDAAERAHAEKAGVNLFLEKGVPYRQLISAVRSQVKR